MMAGDAMVQVAHECSIRCVDVWHTYRLTGDKMAAYRAMMARGRIVLKAVSVFTGAGLTVVEYMASIPPEWIREELGEEARRIAAQGKSVPDALHGGAGAAATA